MPSSAVNGGAGSIRIGKGASSNTGGAVISRNAAGGTAPPSLKLAPDAR